MHEIRQAVFDATKGPVFLILPIGETPTEQRRQIGVNHTPPSHIGLVIKFMFILAIIMVMNAKIPTAIEIVMGIH